MTSRFSCQCYDWIIIGWGGLWASINAAGLVQQQRERISAATGKSTVTALMLEFVFFLQVSPAIFLKCEAKQLNIKIPYNCQMDLYVSLEQ